MEKKNNIFFGFGCFLLFLFFIGGCAHPVAQNTPAPVGWLMDFEQARQTAKEKNLPILAAFVGLDWCPWCQKLEEEVFSQKEFMTYAENHFVLFQADYPNHKQQPAKVKEQNKALAKTYSIDSFPTVLILDGEGKQKGETGYLRGGVRAYLDHLEGLLKK